MFFSEKKASAISLLRLVEPRRSTSLETVPGLAFRVIDEQGQIRPHMNVFLGEESVRDLATPISGAAEIYIVGASSLSRLSRHRRARANSSPHECFSRRRKRPRSRYSD